MHPVVLEPHRARPLVRIDIGPVPTAERRVRRVASQQSHNIRRVFDHVLKKRRWVRVVNHRSQRISRASPEGNPFRDYGVTSTERYSRKPMPAAATHASAASSGALPISVWISA